VVVALSAYLKNTIARNVSDNFSIKVIPNGIEENFFSLDKQRNNWILMSGKLLQFKGFQYAFKAFEGIDLAGWEIHLVGDGPYRHELEEAAGKSKNKVVFHGWLERGSDAFKVLYERSKIFIFLSDSENAPIALLEGMSAGLATITSNVAGCRETAGDAAMLVDPRNVEETKEAVLKLVNNESRIDEYGQKARQRSIEYFSWDDIVDKYLEFAEEVSHT